MIKVARKCVNCRCIYGCKDSDDSNYCVTCLALEECTIICVEDTTGGLCASCLELSRVQRILRKVDTKET